jgi:outer membrane protein assembly factor BamD
MFLKIARLFLFVSVVAMMASCGGGKVVVDGESMRYGKVLKSKDHRLKYKYAMAYYEAKDYMKTLPLLEELLRWRIPEFEEKVYYYYAYSNYGMREYYMASFYFKNFVKKYPSSELAEECSYMSAYCSVRNSPVYSLDQRETTRAIQELQLFLNRYPESTKKDTCNALIDDLRSKLEEKAFENAVQYYRTSHYKSAVIAFKNVLKEFPDTKERETVMFLILKSGYSLAERSIESKKKERFEETIKSYHTFVDNFGQSKRLKEAEVMYNSSVETLEKMNTQIP